MDPLALPEFRERLLHDPEALAELEILLDRLIGTGLDCSVGKAEARAAALTASVRTLNRLCLVMRTMRLALEALEDEAEWLRRHARPHWAHRYGRAAAPFHPPRDTEKREAMALAIAADGYHLLAAIERPGAPAGVAGMPELELLSHVWRWQFSHHDGQVSWRGPVAAPAIPPTAPAHQQATAAQ